MRDHVPHNGAPLSANGNAIPSNGNRIPDSDNPVPDSDNRNSCSLAPTQRSNPGWLASRRCPSPLTLGICATKFSAKGRDDRTPCFLPSGNRSLFSQDYMHQRRFDIRPIPSATLEQRWALRPLLFPRRLRRQVRTICKNAQQSTTQFLPPISSRFTPHARFWCSGNSYGSTIWTSVRHTAALATLCNGNAVQCAKIV